MIEVFDTAAARQALARRRLGCPGCAAPLRPWGRARTRTVHDRDGEQLTCRPDRARCTGCRATHVVLDAGLLAHRGYTVAVVGQALLAAAGGLGHRPVAARLAVPEGTVRGWLRRVRGSAGRLREIGVQTTVMLEPDLLPTRAYADPRVRRPARTPTRSRSLWTRSAPPRWPSAAASRARTSTRGRGSTS
jgi:transposase-like protein